MSPRASSREAILDAAGAIVRECGAAHLTLDAVSARAKVSKGGLLYHFHTKKALLTGMIDRLRGMVADARDAEAARLPGSPLRELKAHVRAMGFFRNPKAAGLAAAVLAAGTENPTLLAPVKTGRRQLIAKLTGPGVSKEFVTIITLALDGMCLLQLLRASNYSPKEHRAITEELFRLIREEEARSCAGKAGG